MFDRRSVLCGLTLTAAVGISSPTLGASRQKFSQQAFAEAQASGKPVLLHITAPWCGTCRAQKPIVAKLELLPKFKDLQIFEIDFDTSKDLLRTLRVIHLSTMIVYRGQQE